MEIIQESAQIHRLIQENNIDEYFSGENLPFHIRTYEKGEFLCSPVNSLDCLLFLVKGTVHLYGLHMDGVKIPVGVVSEVMLFGDMEFSSGRPSDFFAEVAEKATCLALPMQAHQDALWQDVKFLRCLVHALAKKVILDTELNIYAATLEERVLRSFQNIDGIPQIRGIEETALRLRCSRRQLQRVLKKFCENGIASKVGKGIYILQQQGGKTVEEGYLGKEAHSS